jgi:hypothetical protein
VTLNRLRVEIIAIERTFPELRLSQRRRAIRRSVRELTARTRIMSAAARKAVSARMKRCTGRSGGRRKFWRQHLRVSLLRFFFSVERDLDGVTSRTDRVRRKGVEALVGSVIYLNRGVGRSHSMLDFPRMDWCNFFVAAAAISS